VKSPSILFFGDDALPGSSAVKDELFPACETDVPG